MRPPRSTWFLAAACLLLAACSGQTCSDMKFDDFQSADRVVVKQMSKTIVSTIADRTRIVDIARFIEARGNGWSVPFGGTPVGSITLEFYSDGRFLGDLGIGTAFLEAQGCGYFFAHHLTPSERRDLAGLIGISEDLIR
jgi:hypothetical protein